MMKKTFPIFCIAVLCFSSVSADENDYLRPIGRPREARAQRRQGGEAFPPLPLPVTPLRRSEKKRPPSPSALIGKVVWGSYLDYTGPDGMTQRLFDWNMVPADCQQLLRRVKETMRLEYKTQTVDLATFSGNPSELPILHFSGGRTIRFTDAERTKLRKYLFDGGTIIFDSIVGSPYFYRGAMEETRRILPESPVRRIDPDHALFRMVRKTTGEKVNGNRTIAPEFDGAYIGSRLAVILSPYGLGGGWDNIQPDQIRNSRYYTPASARNLGVNLIAYIIGWYENGQAYAAGEAYGEGAEVRSADRIVFAQVRTDGLWNSDPGAETRFMRYLAKNLKMDAGSKPVYVDPATAVLADYPFLYLSGIGNFDLSADAMAKLRGYLNGGGFLLVNNSLGMNEFDAAAQKFSSALYPGKKLEKIPENHPIYTKGPFRFTRNGFLEAAAQKYPSSSRPLLYGIRDGDRYKLIYSPVDIAGGWMAVSRPGSVGYETETALRLGANLVTYFATH